MAKRVELIVKSENNTKSVLIWAHTDNEDNVMYEVWLYANGERLAGENYKTAGWRDALSEASKWVRVGD